MSEICWSQIEETIPEMVRSERGHSRAIRGLATLPGGEKVFVKMSDQPDVLKWLNAERDAYHFLAKHDYPYALRIVAESKEGFAVPDISHLDWDSGWNEQSLDALFTALDELATLSRDAAGNFAQTDYTGNSWDKVPQDLSIFKWAKEFLPDEHWSELKTLIADSALRSEYYSLASTEPWNGEDLVHYDARRDNFAYDPQTGAGFLVDWTWSSIGSKVFDKNKVLINVALHGSDVWQKYRHLLDRASLAFLTGFWLSRVASEQPANAKRRRLRMSQLSSAIVAHRLINETTVYN